MPVNQEPGKKESDTRPENETLDDNLEEFSGKDNELDDSVESPEQEINLPPEQQIEALQEQLKRAEEDVLRAKAQEQNTQRRASLDVEKARKFALESFVKELLPVVDNLERALSSVGPEHQGSEAFVEGVELTLKSFLAALEKNRVQAIDPTGEPFNPEQHQAMTSVENPDVEANTVIEVFQKGYELNGRLMRPAMVVVSKSS